MHGNHYPIVSSPRRPACASDQLGHEILRAVHEAIAGDPRTAHVLDALQITLDGNVVRLCGELPTIEAKRRAVVVTRRALPGGVLLSDDLLVRPFLQMSEHEVRAGVCRELAEDTALKQCAIASRVGGKTCVIARPDGRAAGQICVSVQRDVVRLDGIVPGHMHRRVAEVMAWWCLGARAVENKLSVLSDDTDGDASLACALRHVLDHEPLLYGSRPQVAVSEGEVTLRGTVTDGPSREIAALDAWLVPGVIEVHDRLAARDDLELLQS